MKKIAMVFPGYGSQHVGMGKDFYDDSRIVQEYFEEAGNCLPINFVKLCFASSESELSRMENAYTANFLVSSAIHALLKQEGINADIVAGYNLGEYAAMYAAGAFTFPDGLYLLHKYAMIYQEALASMDVGALKIEGVTTTQLTTICKNASNADEYASIALYTTATDHIVTGNAQAVAAVRGEVAEDPDADEEDVSISIGLHSSLMAPIADKFVPYLEKVDFKTLTVPMICSADICHIQTSEQVRARIIEHITTPVKWTKVMESLASYDVFIEIGPGTMLSSLAKAQYPDKIIMSINKRSDIIDLKKILEISTQTPEL